MRNVVTNTGLEESRLTAVRMENILINKEINRSTRINSFSRTHNSKPTFAPAGVLSGMEGNSVSTPQPMACCPRLPTPQGGGSAGGLRPRLSAWFPAGCEDVTRWGLGAGTQKEHVHFLFIKVICPHPENMRNEKRKKSYPQRHHLGASTVSILEYFLSLCFRKSGCCRWMQQEMGHSEGLEHADNGTVLLCGREMQRPFNSHIPLRIGFPEQFRATDRALGSSPEAGFQAGQFPLGLSASRLMAA